MVQLRLGFSVNGNLILIHPMSQGDPTQEAYESKAGKPALYSTDLAILPGTTHINTLPDELLRYCFELSTASRSPPDRRRPRLFKSENANVGLPQQVHFHPSAQSISLTCTRFWVIMMPILYARIQLIPRVSSFNHQTQKCRVLMKFLRTMNTAPNLRKHIQGLSMSTEHFSQIMVPGPGETPFARLRKVSLAVIDAWSIREWHACCTNLQDLPVLSELSVDLRLRCQDDFRPFYRIAGQLRHLSKLSLKGVCSDRSDLESPVVSDDDPSSLQETSGVGQGALGPQARQVQSCFMTRTNLESKYMSGSASFTQLHLFSFHRSSPAGLRHLLSLPSSLETFTLDTLGMCGYSLETLVAMGCLSHRWTFDQLKELLLQHHYSLQEIRIRQLGPIQEGLDRFDLHPFENLRTLQLCTLCLPCPEKACGLWLTRSLQRIIFESSCNDSQCGIIWHFDDDDVAWLTTFIKIAANRKRSCVSGLRVIEVICEHQIKVSEGPNVEANFSKAKKIVESRGFYFFWRRAI